MDLVAVLGAVGALAVTIAGALGAWWIKISDNRHKQELARMEVERKAKKEDEAARRRDRKDVVDDLEKLVEAQSKEISSSRDEVHDLKSRVEKAETKEHMCQLRLARVETAMGELDNKFTEAMNYIEDLEEALRNLNVPVVRRRRTQAGSGPHKSLLQPPPGEKHE